MSAREELAFAAGALTPARSVEELLDAYAAEVLRKAADEIVAACHDAYDPGNEGVCPIDAIGAANMLRDMAAACPSGAPQPECPASTTGHCLAEHAGETACATEDGECASDNRPVPQLDAEPGEPDPAVSLNPTGRPRRSSAGTRRRKAKGQSGESP